MKNFIFILAMLSFLANCKKNQPPVDIIEDPTDTIPTVIETPIIELGKGYVLKNGIAWNAPFEAWFYHSDSVFYINVEFVNANLYGEHFFLRDIPCKEGKYPIELRRALINHLNQVPDAGFAIFQDYDQGMGFYDTDTTRTDNFLEVLDYDPVEKIVEGQFQVTLKNRESPPDNGTPKYIYMAQGKFHLKIKQP